MSKTWTLVTGGAGFLGARLVRQLVIGGAHVKALVEPGEDLEHLQDLPSEKLRIAVGDIKVVDRVYAALRSCDRVYHTADYPSLDERDAPEVMGRVVEGTKAVLEASRHAGIMKVVAASSAVTLGASRVQDSLTEKSKCNLADPTSYCEAKLLAEEACVAAAGSGQNIVIVNPTNLVGPGDRFQSPVGGQILSYLSYSPAFRVPLWAGGVNYVDVDDVALGLQKAMESGSSGERYVLGGENLTCEQFYQLLADVTGLCEPGDVMSKESAEMRAGWEEWRAWWAGRRAKASKLAVANYFGKYVFVSSAKAERELGYQSRPVRESLTRAAHWLIDSGYVPPHIARRARLELRPA